SWPGLTRPSRSVLASLDARVKPGHDMGQVRKSGASPARETNHTMQRGLRRTISARSPRDPAAELLLDMGADDLVDRPVGVEAQAPRAHRVEAVGPGRHDALDVRIGLPADALRRRLAGDAAHRIDHLAHGDGETGQADAAAPAPLRRLELVG